MFIPLNRSMIKRHAQDIYRSATVRPFSLTALFLGIHFAFQAIDSLVEFFSLHLDLSQSLSLRLTLSFLSILISLMTFILNGGFHSYCLRVTRGESVSYAGLFDCFADVWRVIATYVLMGFFIFLWSLAFFFPAIIAMYRYSFAIYNLLDHPEYTPFEAIQASNEQTRRYGFSLIALDLSFFSMAILPIGLGVIPYLIWIGNQSVLNDSGIYAVLFGDMSGVLMYLMAVLVIVALSIRLVALRSLAFVQCYRILSGETPIQEADPDEFIPHDPFQNT